MLVLLCLIQTNINNILVQNIFGSRKLLVPLESEVMESGFLYLQKEPSGLVVSNFVKTASHLGQRHDRGINSVVKSAQKTYLSTSKDIGIKCYWVKVTKMDRTSVQVLKYLLFKGNFPVINELAYQKYKPK